MEGNVKKAAPPTVMNDLLLGKTQELVSTSEGERNWPGVLIALLVILVVLSLILVSTMLLSPGDRLPRVSKPKMEIKKPIEKKNPPSWTSRNEVVFRNNLGGISIFNPELNKTIELLDNSTFRQLDAVDFLLSADYEYLIFISNIKKIYKNTQEAVYHLYEISSKTRWHIAPVDEDFHTSPYYLNRVQFSPIGHNLAFVHNGQLYYVQNANRKPLLISPKSNDWIIHGHPDWIYQNDILCDDIGFYFSPNGYYLAYITFDDRYVGKIAISKYDNDLYPKIIQIPYPKTGTINPEVNITVVNLNDFTTKILQKPKILEKSTPYLTDIEWNSNSELNLIWVNRRQNLTVLDMCSPPNFTCETKSTMNKIGHLRPSKTIFEVRKFMDMSTSYPYFFKKDNKFFEAHPDNKPTQRHLYFLESEYNPICLTCPLRKGNLTTDVAVPNNTDEEISHPVKSTDCLYTISILSPDGKFYMITCLGPDVPSIHIMDILTNKKLSTIITNNDLRQIYYSYSLPQIKIFQVKLDDMRIAQVKLRLPPGLREYEETTFPFLLKISHRPGEPSVDYKWSMDYDSYLSSSKNYIIAEIDTGEKVIGPGAAYDQISVVRYLISNLNFIDKDKIGIYGFNYGGYLTAMILSLDSQDFKCGISISGVFSWPHYNSVWTEAWLRTANITDNYRGYEDADILRRAGNLKNKKLLMIDSAVDYDVHFQHSMLMIRSLIKADVMFNHMTYPDDPDDLYNSKHFHTLIDQYWDDCFGHPDFTDWELGLTSYLSIQKTG